MAVVLGRGGSMFVRSYETLTEICQSVKEAPRSKKEINKLSKEKLESYINSFELMNALSGLDEEQQQCYEMLLRA